MKKISTNKDDVSFENKLTFSDIINKIRAAGGSIIKNGKGILIAGLAIGSILFSAGYVYIAGETLYSISESKSSGEESNKYALDYNDALVKNLIGKSIIITDLTCSFEMPYHIYDQKLYDKDDNVVSLKGSTLPLYITVFNIDKETLSNIELPLSNTKKVDFAYTSIVNDCISLLPSTVEDLNLDFCFFITNLDLLPETCPNLTKLSLCGNGGLTDLGFIYKLSNLKELIISDSAYVTEDLLNYTKEKGIITNINEEDVNNTKKVDNIVESIIEPNMTDREKIQAVCSYVIHNLEYDMDLSIESNEKPLECFLDKNKGVCASYAYVTNTLLNKAGVESFEVTGSGHGWNIVRVDDKYYYVDTTNMDDGWAFEFLLDEFNVSKYYMVDTENTYLTVMVDSSGENIRIPKSLVNDILDARNDKSALEKYGGPISNISYLVVLFILGSLAWQVVFKTPSNIKKLIKEVPMLHDDIEYDYYTLLLKYSEKKH